MLIVGLTRGLKRKVAYRSLSALLVLIIAASFFPAYSKADEADEVDLIVSPWTNAVGIFSTSGGITLKEGTTPGYTNIYADSDLNTPLDVPGFPPATVAGYDLSSYEIWGAGYTASSRATGDVTMLGGKVSQVSGAGPWGVIGDSNVIIKGGIVTLFVGTGPRFAASGVYNGGKSRLEISGGYIGRGVFCGGVFYAGEAMGDCEITISGGTICEDVQVLYIADGGKREITIAGGTIFREVGKCNEPVFHPYPETIPTDGSNAVYKTTLTIPGIIKQTSMESALRLSGLASNYGTKDMFTNANGELFLYLPAGTSYAYCNGGWYRSDVSSSVNVSNTFYPIDPNEYSFTSGDNNVWQQGTKNDLTFKANGELSDFLGVEIGGTFIDKGRDYSVANGSTIITLENSYLKKLTAGTHEIRAIYRDGVARTDFVVSDTKIPQTGDSNNFSLLLGIVVVSMLGVIITNKYIRKLRRS